MKEFKVKEPAYIAYQLTTYQGSVEIEGEEVKFRYSEDDNGDEFFVLSEEGWEASDLSDPKHLLIYAAIGEWGNPEDWEVDQLIELDDETLEMYS